MKIESLSVENFKSIRKASVEFSDFNLFVGKNAAGKSNIFEIFEFLGDAQTVGLDDAIQLQGGVEHLRNKRIKNDQSLKIDIKKKNKGKIGLHVENKSEEALKSTIKSTKKIELKFNNSEEYTVDVDEQSITIPSNEKHPRYRVNIRDTIQNNVFNYTKTRVGRSGGAKYGVYESIDEEGGEYALKDLIDFLEIEFSDIEPLVVESAKTYDINTRKIRKSTDVKGRTQLEPDGSNLALVIRNIIKDKNRKEKFVGLVSDVLPFVTDSDVETMEDQSLFLKILEEFEPGEDQYIPASMLSDGTLRVLATIVLLYFTDEETILIEEPGRNVHPSLIANLMAKMKDVAENTDKQIFITTHNVEMLRHAPLESIRLVSRGDDGFTQVEQPSESERVQTFLENGMGIDDLYVENLLEE